MARRAPSAPLLLVTVGLGVFLAALDQTVVVTALPRLMDDLRIPVTELDRASWIITGYLLGYTVAMPLMGRVADVYGHRRIYQLSLLLFALGSLLVALSSSLRWVVASRVVQAVGGGATVPIAMAMTASALPVQRRVLALGLVGAAAEAGSVLGPLYGGSIIHLVGWRWIFWANLPLGLLLMGALAFIPSTEDKAARVDYLGGALLAGCLTTLSIALSRREVFAGASVVPYALVGLGLSLLLALVWAERRAVQPLLAPFLLRSSAAVAANATQLLVGIALIVVMVNVPLMANTVMGREALEGGLWLMRLTGAIPVGAVIGGLALSRLSPGDTEDVDGRSVALVGLFLVALGFLFLSRWQTDVREPWLTLHLATGGLGFGLVIAPTIYTVLGAAPEEYRATAASLVTVARMVGMTLGLAAVTAWGMDHFQGLTRGLEFPIAVPGETSQQFEARSAEYLSRLTEASMTLFRHFFLAGGVVALAAALPVLWMRHRRSS